MKALQLFNHYLPFSENWSYNLIRHLPDTEVFIGARYYLTNNFYSPRFKFFPQHPQGVLEEKYRQLSKYRLKELIQKMAIKAIQPFSGNLILDLIQYGKEKNIDLVHAHFANVAWMFREVPQKLGCPFVISFYGWDYEKLPHTQPQFIKYYQMLFQQADAFICEGGHGASILAKMGCPKHKIHVVHLGVEVEQIPFFKRDKKPGELKLLQIAGFTEKKGQLYTVRAFAAARKSCPNIELTLVGNSRDAVYYNQVIQEIASLGLQDVIRVLPFIDYGLLHEFMEDYHVFIHPSCYAKDKDCEGGAPVILLDAQATGMPVIATRHCDIPEEVIDLRTGFLTKEQDLENLTKAIKSFYSMEEEVYHRMICHSRRHITEKYDIRQNAIFLKNCYEMLC